MDSKRKLRWESATDPLECLEQTGSGAPSSQTNQQVVVFEQRTSDDRFASKKIFLFASLRGILLEVPNSKILVFASEKSLCEELCTTLSNEGHTCGTFFGQMKAAGRTRLVEEFSEGSLRMLVATDGVARYLLDLNPRGATHVINFDWCEIEDYASRIRVIAPQAPAGLAVTLFEYDDKYPSTADAYVRMLEAARQEVPQELRTIASEVKSGRRVINKAFFKKKKKETWDSEVKAAWQARFGEASS